MESSAERSIAVLFAIQGGMGDVGKFAAAHAVKTADLTVRVVALASSATEEVNAPIDVDVTDGALRSALKSDFESITLERVDIDAADAQAQLASVLHGVEAVVACLGSRQPGFGRWCGAGATMLTAAMEEKGVRRLVVLSSMGIGDDFMQLGAVRVFWAFLLRTAFRAVRADLAELEAVVERSSLDYLIVRAVALTPSEPPRGDWKLLRSKDDGGLTISVAKKDVAEFMVMEALNPSLDQVSVTIGQEK